MDPDFMSDFVLDQYTKQQKHLEKRVSFYRDALTRWLADENEIRIDKGYKQYPDLHFAAIHRTKKVRKEYQQFLKDAEKELEDHKALTPEQWWALPFRERYPVSSSSAKYRAGF